MRKLYSFLFFIFLLAAIPVLAVSAEEGDLKIDLSGIIDELREMVLDLMRQVYLGLIYPIIGAITGWAAGWRLGKGLETTGYLSGGAGMLMSVVLGIVGSASMWVIGPRLAEMLSHALG